MFFILWKILYAILFRSEQDYASCGISIIVMLLLEGIYQNTISFFQPSFDWTISIFHPTRLSSPFGAGGQEIKNNNIIISLRTLKVGKRERITASIVVIRFA
jgi:hypothetical protein